MIIDKHILIGFVTIFLFIPEMSSQINDNHDTIYWRATNKLKWDDFQGHPPESYLTSYGTEAAAATDAEIKIKIRIIGDSIYFKAYSLFIKTKSWHKSKSEKVLTHEQLHFDIAELVARKIRKELNMLILNNLMDTALYLNKIKELMANQDYLDSLYDNETLHGAIDSMQMEWCKKIAKELCELKDYEVDYPRSSQSSESKR